MNANPQGNVVSSRGIRLQYVVIDQTRLGESRHGVAIQSILTTFDLIFSSTLYTSIRTHYSELLYISYCSILTLFLRLVIQPRTSSANPASTSGPPWPTQSPSTKNKHELERQFKSKPGHEYDYEYEYYTSEATVL